MDINPSLMTKEVINKLLVNISKGFAGAVPERHHKSTMPPADSSCKNRLTLVFLRFLTGSDLQTHHF